MSARDLQLIDPDEGLPVYPVARSERLDGHSFVKWQFHRWMASRTFRLASWEEQGMARALFDYAQTESPPGTLPDDDDELAVMLRVDRRRMRELRGRDFGPLRGWKRCLCDGEVRLAHDVVTEQVLDALDRREARSERSSSRVDRMRLKRLRDALADMGLSAAVLKDRVLIERIDRWMTENCRGNRRAAEYAAALLHAQREKWLAPAEVVRGR